jgi:aminoglycoside 3-N-acetyltransferase
MLWNSADMFRSKILTKNMIVSGLNRLGLAQGDLVIVHSSLSSFGFVEGGAETFVKALMEVLGPNGTIVVPTFFTFFKGEPNQVYDIDKTPSRMGKVTEVVRLLPEAIRSHDPIVPLAAIGPLARDIVDRDFTNCWGKDSSFGRLLELNAWILLTGVTYNSCTMFHLVEGIAQVPYREWKDQEGYIVENGKASQKVFKRYALKRGFNTDFNRVGLIMELRGLVRKNIVGRSTLRLFRARDLYRVSLEQLKEDPHAFLAKWDRFIVYFSLQLTNCFLRWLS